MAFKIQGLPASTFRDLFSKSDEELALLAMRRCVAEEKPGFPCRVSLQDAEVGETLILGPYEHHRNGPYRASGPIFVREAAVESYEGVDEVPQQLAIRLLSLRAYDRTGLLRKADIMEGSDLAEVIKTYFQDTQVDYIHTHNARAGCFLCSIHRA